MWANRRSIKNDFLIEPQRFVAAAKFRMLKSADAAVKNLLTRLKNCHAYLIEKKLAATCSSGLQLWWLPVQPKITKFLLSTINAHYRVKQVPFDQWNTWVIKFWSPVSEKMGEDRRACSKSKFTRAARITILCMNFQPKTRQEIPKVRARLILVITVKLGLLLKRQGERLWKEFSPEQKVRGKIWWRRESTDFPDFFWNLIGLSAEYRNLIGQKFIKIFVGIFGRKLSICAAIPKLWGQICIKVAQFLISALFIG